MPYNLKPQIKINYASSVVDFNKEANELFKKRQVAIETYPGTRLNELKKALAKINYQGLIVDTLSFANVTATEFKAAISADLTNDRVFGKLTALNYADFFDLAKVSQWLINNANKSYVVIGIGAHLFMHEKSLLIYADLPRWEIQLRYRNGEGVYFGESLEEDNLRNFKRGYFVEWRMADRVKREIWNKVDYFIDWASWNLLPGSLVRKATNECAARPFRLVPYFDAGVWGGTWMAKHLGLPPHPSGKNYAWGFDGVPEENSVILAFSDKVTYEMPAINIVLFAAKALLGEAVYNRFGEEFPIRFDMLDTIGGQNLSLQVHPTTRYAQEHFNLHYTQEESYYILDVDAKAKPVAYLGLKTSESLARFGEALRKAQVTNVFDVTKWVNAVLVKKHNHLHHPAGCVHASGAGTMVLEVSSTPYIFTFKLWDWARVDFDGKPRPINIDRGLAVIDRDFDEHKVLSECASPLEKLSESDKVLIEKTGLHERQFIETRRYTLTPDASIVIKSNGSVNLLNLVEGTEVITESLNSRFSPFKTSYVETFIVPASCGDFKLTNPTKRTIKVLHAYVRHSS